MSSRAIADWRGVFPSLCTPFDEDEAVDLDAVREVAQFAVQSGAHGVVALGVAGEVEKLSSEERNQIIAAIVLGIEGRVPVLAGATGHCLSASLELAGSAERLGVDGIVLPAPGHLKLGDDQLADYFAEVAASVDVPVIVQDAPEYIGVSVAPAIVERAAAKAPNICGVKLELGPEGIEHWRSQLSDRLLVFSGSGGLHMLDCLDAGVAGVMPGSDLTDRLVAVYELYAAGDADAARARFAELLPMLTYEMQSMDHYNLCAKELLSWRGVAFRSTATRRPGRDVLGDAARARLERYASAIGVMPGSAV
jgi:2-keto-3-deoxy-L-arabinonate dehydratase